MNAFSRPLSRSSFRRWPTLASILIAQRRRSCLMAVIEGQPISSIALSGGNVHQLQFAAARQLTGPLS